MYEEQGRAHVFSDAEAAMLNTPHKDLIRATFALLLLAHGIAHFVGFGHAWRLLTPDPYVYRTTLFGSHLDVGDGGMRTLGVVWLILGLAFIGVSGAALLKTPWWMGAAGAVATASFVMCALQRPDASVGLALNAIIIVALLAVARLSQLAAS